MIRLALVTAVASGARLVPNVEMSALTCPTQMSNTQNAFLQQRVGYSMQNGTNVTEEMPEWHTMYMSCVKLTESVELDPKGSDYDVQKCSEKCSEEKIAGKSPGEKLCVGHRLVMSMEGCACIRGDMNENQLKQSKAMCNRKCKNGADECGAMTNSDWVSSYIWWGCLHGTTVPTTTISTTTEAPPALPPAEDNDTAPPVNDTAPPVNDTAPPVNDTAPPVNDTAPAPAGPKCQYQPENRFKAAFYKPKHKNFRRMTLEEAKEVCTKDSHCIGVQKHVNKKNTEYFYLLTSANSEVADLENSWAKKCTTKGQEILSHKKRGCNGNSEHSHMRTPLRKVCG